MTPVVADTTVLSNFAHIGQPDLLRMAFPDLAAPPAVQDELKEGERLGHLPAGGWDWLASIDLSAAEQARAAEIGQTLGRGESACLAVCESRGWMMLTDDRDARRVAGSLGVAVSGTLGVLVRLITASALPATEADSLLAQMRAHGYHSPVESLRELGINDEQS